MARRNNNRLDAFWDQISIEMDLTVGCKTNAGFIERVVRLMSLLRTNVFTRDVIKQYEKRIVNDHLPAQAYRELADACSVLKKYITKKKNRPYQQTLEDIFEEVCCEGSCLKITEPPYSRVYYKLRSLYVLIVVKTDDITFAPSALTLITQDKIINMLTREDIDPCYLWRELMGLEQCWLKRNDPICIAWPRIQGDDEEVWLQSDKVYKQAYQNMMAGRLKYVDDPSFDTNRFEREYFEKLVERLIKEIKLAPQVVRVASIENLRGKLRYNDTRLDDKAKGIEQMRSYCEKNPDAKLDDVAGWLHREAKAKRVHFVQIRQPSTYKAWAREAGLQSPDAKFRGKDKNPRKTQN